MAKIQFEDKVALNENSNIPDVNKCKATDMNEIKSVVNGNDDLVGDLSTLNTTNKSSIVGAINELKKFVGNGDEGYVIFPNNFKIVWGKVPTTKFRDGLIKKHTLNLPINFESFNIAFASNIYNQGFTNQGISFVTLTQLELTCEINSISDYFVTYIVIGV